MIHNKLAYDKPTGNATTYPTLKLLSNHTLTITNACGKINNSFNSTIR